MILVPNLRSSVSFREMAVQPSWVEKPVSQSIEWVPFQEINLRTGVLKYVCLGGRAGRYDGRE